MNYIILNIRNSIINLPIIHPTMIQHKNYHWKTLKAFIQESSQNIQELNQNIQELQKVTMSSSQNMQELKNATMSNTQNLQELKQFTHQAFASIEGQIDYLVAELNKIKEEELQSQLMAQGHYMIDEDDTSNSCHEHVPNTTILESEEIVDDNVEEEKKE